jgi:hypothetical protein
VASERGNENGVQIIPRQCTVHDQSSKGTIRKTERKEIRLRREKAEDP